MASTTLSAAAKDMLTEAIVATVATVNADGSIHLTPTWIDVDGEDIIVNTLTSRKKSTNTRRNQQVGVSVIDPTNPFRVISVSGTVVDAVEEGAEAHIDALTQRYMGLDKHPFNHDGEVRVMLRIRPDTVLIQPS